MRWLLLALLPVSIVSPTFAAEDANEDGPRDYLMVRLDREVPLEPESLRTGLDQFDALNQAFQVSDLRKVFRDPPRGRKNPEAWRRLGLGRWYTIEFGRDREDLDLLALEYGSLPEVEIVERDSHVYPTVLPDDPDYGPQQWSLKPNRTDAEGAWDVLTDSSSDQLIFVIDTGVEVTHSDIQDNLWMNPGEIPNNGIDDDLNGFVDDIYGWDFVSDDATVEDDWPHGMHVNGIIGAVGNNNHMVAGVNWKCRLAQGKMFGQRTGTWEHGAQATVYAVDNGATVINNSWGGGTPPQVYEDALAYSDQSDVLNVAGAGNTGSTTEFYPAAFPEMLAVASTDSADRLSGFSTHGDWIDMAAPGENIYNLWINDSTATISGTSMASPHVAGAGALIRSLNPQLTNLEARLILRHATEDLGAPGFDSDFGWGRLNVHEAVDTANSLRLSTTNPDAGDTVSIDLSFGGESNMLYFMLSSQSGQLPGVPFSDPNDHRVLPLNPDFWTMFSLQPNPFTLNFVGTLDFLGNASASFVIPAHPFFLDQTFSLVYVTIDPLDFTQVRRVSAPLSFYVNP